MVWVLSALLVAVSVKCIGNKIAALALLLYIEEHGKVPDKEEINEYTSRATKELFHRLR